MNSLYLLSKMKYNGAIKIDIQELSLSHYITPIWKDSWVSRRKTLNNQQLKNKRMKYSKYLPNKYFIAALFYKVCSEN